MASVMHVHQLDTKNTLDDLRETVLRHGPQVLKGEIPPMHVTVNGYDEDPRELWEVPQVRRLCERVIESGLLSILTVNLGKNRSDGVWGAFDVWACATGRIKVRKGQGRLAVTMKDMRTFQRVLLDANETCDAILKEDTRIEGGTPETGTWGRD